MVTIPLGAKHLLLGNVGLVRMMSTFGSVLHSQPTPPLPRLALSPAGPASDMALAMDPGLNSEILQTGKLRNPEC